LDADYKLTDPIAVYVKNVSDMPTSYRLAAVDGTGKEIPNFMPYAGKRGNFDYYASVLLRADGAYIPFSKTFSDLLDEGRRPVAPTYLRAKNGTGSTLELEWDVNETTNTGSYYLFRSQSPQIACENQYYYKKFTYGNSISSFAVDPGDYHYVMCASDTEGGT
jgi:hypothetical protein